MIGGERFLVLGEQWGFHPTTTQHLLRPFMRDNQFLWVHLLGARRWQWNTYDLERALSQLSHWVLGRDHIRQAHVGPPTCSPVLLPFSANPVVRWWNRRSTVASVSTRWNELRTARPIFFATLPSAAEVLGAFHEELVVYLCLDEYAEMPAAHRDYVRDIEEMMLDRADLVLVTAKTLIGAKSRLGKPALLLPQGIEFEHFARAWSEPAPEPPELAGLPHPRLGFVGLLAPWLDQDILVALARAYPRASVVLIGPPRTDIGKLKSQPNIHLLGAKPYGDLPRYLRYFDAGLIPFQQNRLTQYVNPLKLLEYLAAGLPVISTALPDVVDLFGDVVYCAHDTEEFVAMTAQALDDTCELRKQRITVARLNSWEQRAEELSLHLEALLADRRAA